ncbi:MAG: hypothetical protein LBC77_07875 [Spirochaetaceae bacterium]|jgi:hypothetical protein|nr:hypothetical protein [Spirochaetaceae bacterium]
MMKSESLVLGYKCAAASSPRAASGAPRSARCPLSTVHYPLTTALRAPSAAHCPLSTTHCPLSTVHCPLLSAALFLIFALIAAAPAFSQSFIIIEEAVVVEGRTRGEAALKRLGSASGRAFQSREELEAFAEERGRELEALRLFQSSSVSVQYGGAQDGGDVPVTLTIHIKDGIPVIPIPYAIFNSNTGFMGGLYLQLPNIAGSLQSVQFVGLYNAYYGKDNTLQWESPNFEALAQWFGVAAGPLTLSFTAFAARRNEIITDRGQAQIAYRGLFLGGEAQGRYGLGRSLALSLSVKPVFASGIELKDVFNEGYYGYGPYNYKAEGKLALEFEDIQWRANLRKGLRAHLSAGLAVLEPLYSKLRTFGLFRAEAAAYTVLGAVVSPSARLCAVFHTGKPSLLMGKEIRGVIDNELTGNAGVYLNTGLQIRLFKLGKTELHLLPTFDAAFVFASCYDSGAHSALAAGAELMFFDERLKSFPVRIGAAYDLRAGGNSARKLEIDFNMQFSY